MANKRLRHWENFDLLKKMWCCVGLTVERKSDELIKVELPPRKVWKADLSSVSPTPGPTTDGDELKCPKPPNFFFR